MVAYQPSADKFAVVPGKIFGDRRRAVGVVCVSSFHDRYPSARAAVERIIPARVRTLSSAVIQFMPFPFFEMARHSTARGLKVSG
jgi:hypothetical protein